MNINLCQLVTEAQDIIDLYHAPRHAIEDTLKRPCYSGCLKNLNVTILAAPCHGFGDVIFATKFARYLKFGMFGKGGYSKNVTIVTPTIEMFQKLGVTDVNLISLTGTVKQCRKFKNYSRPANYPKQDLIFVAPLMMDYDVDYADVRGLFKESNPFNTLFLSEYQDALDKGFDILTGVGKDYDGLLFDGLKPAKKLAKLGTQPYVLAYLAKNAGIPYCLTNFVKMVVAKYHNKYPKLQIVVPDWGAKKLMTSKSIKNFIKKYYGNLVIKLKDSTTTVFSSDQKSILTIRGDILSVPRHEMMSLIKYSLPDILATGDQSITDVIDCCQTKNIWYQTVSWKKDLATALAKALPQKYLGNSKTSCGTLKAIRWNNKGSNFKKNNDFRKKAKHIIDSAFRAASEAADPSSVIYHYLKQLKKSRNRKKLIEIVC